jgi:SET and MYND domain-containing protein
MRLDTNKFNCKICLPYIDPALYQTRQQIFNLTYGFTCTCPSCAFAEEVGPIPQPPQLPSERKSLEKSLRDFVFPSFSNQPFALSLPSKPYEAIPDNLLPVLNESFLGALSQVFSTTSHDGPYRSALDVGITILAVYGLLYPPNYPQIGALYFRKLDLLFT